MNLFYATRLSLPSNTAQSLQIEQMSINFKKLFNFKLISPLTDQNYNQTKFYSWTRLPIFFKKNILKYFEFLIKLFFFLFYKNINIIFNNLLNLFLYIKENFAMRFIKSLSFLQKFLLKFL